jgi:NAD(P)-dependent dehydrogenase (short-subunit alcohol dehydrogenase family)
VALLDIDGERAAAEASALATDHGVRTLGLGVDVGDAADVERAANTVAQQLGGADLVFSNVGVQQIGALERFSDEAWTWMLDVNVVGAARVARSFLPLLRRSDSPRLAFTAALLLAFYEPVKLAEDLAVVDLLSRGRVSYVIGLGYRDEEFALFGVDRRKRAGPGRAAYRDSAWPMGGRGRRG